MESSIRRLFSEQCIKLSLDVGVHGNYNGNNVYKWQLTRSEKSAESSYKVESVIFLWVKSIYCTGNVSAL